MEAKHANLVSTDILDFSEEGLRVIAGVTRRPPPSKPAEKNPDTLRRIFSAQKKVSVPVNHMKADADDCC